LHDTAAGATTHRAIAQALNDRAAFGPREAVSGTTARCEISTISDNKKFAPVDNPQGGELRALSLTSDLSLS